MKLLEIQRKKTFEVPSCFQKHLEDNEDPSRRNSKLVLLQSSNFPVREEQIGVRVDLGYMFITIHAIIHCIYIAYIQS